jgi:hypothetical protein
MRLRRLSDARDEFRGYHRSLQALLDWPQPDYLWIGRNCGNSITSSARSGIAAGISNPIALAVFR